MEEIKWVDEINEEKEKWKKRSICKVPSQVKELNKNAYRPQTISFGPYHHGEENLMVMEEHKHRVLINFLKRCDKPIELLFERLDQVVDELRESYLPLDPIWVLDKSKFLQMMILDGCFILEFLRVNSKTSINSHDDDPVFGTHGKHYLETNIIRDMIILENQIPMTVLCILHDIQLGGLDDKRELEKKLVELLDFDTPSSGSLGKCMHVLELYRKLLVLQTAEVEVTRDVKKHDPSFRSAIELHEAGISFEVSKSDSFMDVSFDPAGVLRLPRIGLHDKTEYIFHNLIAFESLNIGVGREVTMFLSFMDSIINSAKDVSILCESGIIINELGSYEDIAKLFNSLSKETPVYHNKGFGIMRMDINYFCMKPWNRWRASLIQTYFRNPWSIVSLIAAIFLFLLTIIQTIYTVNQFYQKQN